MEKIIHQIWIGPYHITERDRILSQKVKEMNPDYKYIFWDNDNLPELPEKLVELKKIFLEQKDWVKIADMIRLYIVYTYGGIYMDCDYEVFKPFSELKLDDKDGYVHLNHWDNDPTICHSFFGFKKNHPMLEYIYNNISNRWLGPHFFGEYLKEYIGLDYTIDFDDRIVHNKLNELNISSNASLQELREFAWHHGSATWLKENQDKLEINTNFKGL
jgi:mannosyltransferase OCH1-like enzyme